jgi:tryptophan synthase alpha chain
MNRIDKLFNEKKNNILSIYFTAGYPQLDSTADIIRHLSEAGADMIEIGIPFSDPMADGPVIQKSNQKALQNGMTLKLLFNQLKNIRKDTEVPLVLMGYLNPVLQFGIENFCRISEETGIDGVILPDLPPVVFKEVYSDVFEKYGLYNILLISPQSSDERISALDKISKGFLYMVSSSSVTGAKSSFSEDQISYFKRVHNMGLKNPRLIGFGISDKSTFSTAGNFAMGGIIGSAFLKILEKEGNIRGNIIEFVNKIKQ